jgi:hypothetical protein
MKTERVISVNCIFFFFSHYTWKCKVSALNACGYAMCLCILIEEYINRDTKYDLGASQQINSLHILNIVGYFMYISTKWLLLTCAKLYIKTLYLNFVF